MMTRRGTSLDTLNSMGTRAMGLNAAMSHEVAMSQA